jgi:hypothetical protein
MGPGVAEIWVSTGEAGHRLRWESIKGVQIVRQTEDISFQGPGEDEMKEQQRHGLTPRFICQGDHVIHILIKTGPVCMGPSTVGTPPTWQIL